MSQQFTGYLCEHSDAKTIICGADAIIELTFSELDDDGPMVSTAYACAEHAEAMRQSRPDYDVAILPQAKAMAPVLADVFGRFGMPVYSCQSFYNNGQVHNCTCGTCAMAVIG